MNRAAGPILAKGRILIVDEDPAVCSLAVRALERAGFKCDLAGDGVDALQKLALTQYDVLITDLCMPRMHGFALANELLSRENRPLIVVLTAVTEPRLACHLIKRGADDYIVKPTDYAVLAAKIESLLNRRQRITQPDIKAERPLIPSTVQPLSTSDVQAELERCTENAFVAPSALDVYLVSRGDHYSTHHAVTAISRDPQLVSAVLQLSNTTFFNPSGRHVVSVEDAVMLLGQKRIGELTLGMQLLATIGGALPIWFNGDWLRKRSLSAAFTADWLVRHSDQECIRPGILLGSIVHLLGRGLLASLFPERYQTAFSQSHERQSSLEELEQHLFQESPSDILATLLTQAGVPKEDCEALSHIARPYSTLHELTTNLRRRTELMKFSAFIGAMASAQWMPWDSIELPPNSVGTALGVNSLETVVNVIQSGLTTRRDARLIPQDRTRLIHGSDQEISYCNLSSDPLDSMRPLTASAGISLKPCEPCRLKNTPRVLVNCVGATEGAVATFLGNENWMDRLVLRMVEGDGAPKYQTLHFPCSYSRLADFLQHAMAGPLPGPRAVWPSQLSSEIHDHLPV